MITDWSHPTWKLLHTFASKINERYFILNKKEIIDIIKSILNILPCPTCRLDATNYVKTLTERTIKNKNDFINYLFNFHNYVNLKTHKRAFDITILKQYNNYNILQVSNNFFSVMYNYKQRGLFLYDSFYRKKIIKNMSEYFHKNFKNMFA